MFVADANRAFVLNCSLDGDECNTIEVEKAFHAVAVHVRTGNALPHCVALQVVQQAALCLLVDHSSLCIFSQFNYQMIFK